MVTSSLYISTLTQTKSGATFMKSTINRRLWTFNHCNWYSIHCPHWPNWIDKKENHSILPPLRNVRRIYLSTSPVAGVTRLLRPLKDGPLENLSGGRGGGEVPKKYLRKGKLNEKKIHARQLTLKKYSYHVLKKKIHTWNLITKTNSYGPKIPQPHHNFSNGPSLMKPLLYSLCII